MRDKNKIVGRFGKSIVYEESRDFPERALMHRNRQLREIFGPGYISPRRDKSGLLKPLLPGGRPK
jgi:hypothetical protein